MSTKKILIADGTEQVERGLGSDSRMGNYSFRFLSRGKDCLEMIERFAPDLILIDLLLPEVHGIEIINKLEEKGIKVGVILFSDQVLVQNYQTALDHGAVDYFTLPATNDEIFNRIESFFAGTLNFSSSKPEQPKENGKVYTPEINLKQYIRFWGTRGSYPVSGAQYNRFGGNTSCLEVRDGKSVVIIDGGTGILNLGKQLVADGIKKIDLFLSHYHWDHLIGLPYFAPFYEEGFEVSIWGPVSFERDVQGVMIELLSPIHFPLQLDKMKAKISYHNLRDLQKIDLKGITVEAIHTYHPGVTFGFKISVAEKQIIYTTDNELFMGHLGKPKEIPPEKIKPNEKFITFCKGCDLLIHEAQYFPEEYEKKIGWGHSSMTNATALVEMCGAKKWFITHHDPSHSDLDLQKKTWMHRTLIKELGISCMVLHAYEGLLFSL